MATEYNEFRPRTWAEYVPPSCEYKLSYIKKRIADGNWVDVGAIYIDGANGTGKTTLAQLIARSTLCINRPKGSWDNCGTCDVCTGKQDPSIIDVTIKQAKDARELFEDILSRTRTAPIARGRGQDRNRYFVIINEFQVVSREAASYLLDALENPLPHVTWILVSMEPERLSEQVRGAIEGRCRHISLTKPTQENIIQALSRHPNITKEVAKAIVMYSGDNYRRAWSELTILLKDNLELTSEQVHKALAKGATPSKRQKLYELIKGGNHKEAIALRNQWEIDDDTLYDLLMRDIINGGKINILLVQAMGQWQSCKTKFQLVNVLLGFLGQDIVYATALETPPTVKISEVLKTKTYTELKALTP